jgi:hypothetical protein
LLFVGFLFVVLQIPMAETWKVINGIQIRRQQAFYGIIHIQQLQLMFPVVFALN